jgi:DNA-binding IscR family transcriptional regulator
MLSKKAKYAVKALLALAEHPSLPLAPELPDLSHRRASRPEMSWDPPSLVISEVVLGRL